MVSVEEAARMQERTPDGCSQSSGKRSHTCRQQVINNSKHRRDQPVPPTRTSLQTALVLPASLYQNISYRLRVLHAERPATSAASVPRATYLRSRAIATIHLRTACGFETAITKSNHVHLTPSMLLLFSPRHPLNSTWSQHPDHLSSRTMQQMTQHGCSEGTRPFRRRPGYAPNQSTKARHGALLPAYRQELGYSYQGRRRWSGLLAANSAAKNGEMACTAR